MAFYPFGAVSALGNSVPWTPQDNGMQAANATVDGVGNTFIPTAGVLYLGKIWARTQLTVTSIAYQVRTAGVGSSTGSFVGAYSPAGLLLAGSGDVGGNLTSANDYSSTLTSPGPQVIPAGTFFWAAFLCNLATTQPTLNCYGAASFTVPNQGLTAATARAASIGTGQTTLPASFTPSSLTPGGVPIWFGVF